MYVVKYSVIIPFYNSKHTLNSLIDSLKNISTLKWEVEFIFINNCSTDTGENLIHESFYDTDFNYHIYSFNHFPSSYAARNIGVNAANGEFLIFTDADCKPSPNWVEQIDNVFTEFNSANLVISGQVKLEIEDETNIWELFDYHFHMDNERAEKNYRVATANMAVQKSFFEEVGYFEEVTSGGDHKWSEMAIKAGGLIKYDPSVLVKHPTRKTKSAILKKVKRTSAGLGELSNSSILAFIKGLLKTLFRPLLFHRHIEFAFSKGKTMGAVFRMKLLWTSFFVRCHQIPAFFKGLLKDNY